MRYAAHISNLVATADAEKALEDTIFKTTYRRSMAKALALWNTQARSSVSSDIIIDELKRKLVVLNATRRNSTYDSVVILNNLLENNRKVI